MERAIQEAQEETDEQGTKAKEQVGTRALGTRTRTRIRRIVVKKRMLVFYRMSKAQKRRKRRRM